MLFTAISFSAGAKDAINMLIEAGLSENTPESIAAFLRTAPGINMVALGEYLGKNSEFNLAVMHHFIESFQFGNTPFVESLRSVKLGHFG
jgi:Sec7-like guanine-nucleotide exchange factor